MVGTNGSRTGPAHRTAQGMKKVLRRYYGQVLGRDVRVRASTTRRQWTDVCAGPMPDGASHQPSGEPSVELRCRDRNRNIAEDLEADLPVVVGPVRRRT